MAVEEVGHNNINFMYEDLQNGDTRFYYVEDGRETASAYVDRDAHKIVYTDYNTGECTVQSYEVAVHSSQIKAAPASYINAGSITYNIFSSTSSTPTGTRTLNCSYSRTYDAHDKYNLAGTYQNALGLASIISGVFTLPGVLSSVVAQKVLAYFGLGTGVASFIIPDVWVDCKTTTVSWKLQDANVAALSEILTGSKCDYTIDGKSESATEATYWPTSSYRDQNIDFAFYIYPYVYGSLGSFGIKSWG